MLFHILPHFPLLSLSSPYPFYYFRFSSLPNAPSSPIALPLPHLSSSPPPQFSSCFTASSFLPPKMQLKILITVASTFLPAENIINIQKHAQEST